MLVQRVNVVNYLILGNIVSLDRGASLSHVFSSYNLQSVFEICIPGVVNAFHSICINSIKQFVHVELFVLHALSSVTLDFNGCIAALVHIYNTLCCIYLSCAYEHCCTTCNTRECCCRHCCCHCCAVKFLCEYILSHNTFSPYCYFFFLFFLSKTNAPTTKANPAITMISIACEPVLGSFVCLWFTTLKCAYLSDPDPLTYHSPLDPL